MENLPAARVAVCGLTLVIFPRCTPARYSGHMVAMWTPQRKNKPAKAGTATIKVEEGHTGAWFCKHYACAIDDTKPGQLGLCDKCNALLEAGAKVVKVGTPKFKLRDRVRWALHDGSNKLATVTKVPTRRSTGLLFDGQYAYDIQCDEANERGYKGPHRTAEKHLQLVQAAGAGSK